MSNPIQQEGNFRGIITAYGLYEPGKNGSKSVAVSLKFLIQEAWDEENQQWDNWQQYDLEAEGDVWVIGTKGNILHDAINSLVSNAGWDGDCLAVAEQRWKPAPCQFSVKMESDPNGKYPDKFKAQFVKHWDAIPGGGKKFLDANAAKVLASKYGAQMRALAGSAVQNAVVPSTKKPSIPATATKSTITKPKNTAELNAMLQEENEKHRDEIPF